MSTRSQPAAHLRVPPEAPGRDLFISEIFLTVCGEGSEAGLPAVFVRTSGCNLRCPGWPCDTPYTSAAPEGSWRSVEEVLSEVRSHPCRRVFLTGGEPLLWRAPLADLAARLKAEGCTVLLQSNGAIDAPEVFRHCDLVSLDCKTPSSGEEADTRLLASVLQSHPSVQVKFAVRDESDFRFAAEQSRWLREQPGGRQASYCVQPVNEVGQDDRGSLLAKLGWLHRRVLEEGLDWLRVLPQIHVLLHGSAARGV